MDNKFDEIIKKHAVAQQVSPSEKVARVLGFKMFFKNILFFHKVKAIAGIVTIAAIASTAYYTTESNKIADCNCKLNNRIVGENEANQKLLAIKNVNSGNNIADNHVNVSQSDTTPLNKDNSDLKTSSSDQHSLVSQNDNPHTSSNSVQGSDAQKDNSDVSKDVDFAKVEKKSNSNTLNNYNNTTADKMVAKNELKEESENLKVEQFSKVQNTSVTESNLQKISPIPAIHLTSEIENSSVNGVPEIEMNQDDYATKKSTRGISIDAYYGVVSKSKINNSLAKGSSEYYWDFYKQNGYQKSTYGGLNVNYMYNGFKFGSGLGCYKINETRPNYKYEYDTTTFLPFGGIILSGTRVYEEDTTLILYTPHEQDVMSAFESNQNSYTYITIPLSVGYELYLKKISFEANTGIVYQRLIGTDGLSVKVDDYEDESKGLYYYSDRYMTTTNKNKDAFNKNMLRLNLNLISRYRMTDQLDLFAGVNYGASFNTIYKKEYFIEKNVQNFGVNFGVTYHLNKRI